MSQVAAELQQQLALASTKQEKDKELEKDKEPSEEAAEVADKKEEKSAAPKLVAVPLPSVEVPAKP